MKFLTNGHTSIEAMLKDEKGQTMVEYALLLVLIALVVAAAIPGVATAIGNAYTAIATLLTST